MSLTSQRRFFRVSKFVCGRGAFGFAKLLETIEFTDDAGRVLGRFLPSAALEPKASNEEIEQRLKKGGGRPLADIMSDLEKRT
jgi:hypothetical protein